MKRINPFTARHAFMGGRMHLFAGQRLPIFSPPPARRKRMAGSRQFFFGLSAPIYRSWMLIRCVVAAMDRRRAKMKGEENASLS